MIKANIIIQAPMIFDRLMVSPRIRIAKAAATITSRVEILQNKPHRLEPVKPTTDPRCSYLFQHPQAGKISEKKLNHLPFY
jgi:hypothetical protein